MVGNVCSNSLLGIPRITIENKWLDWTVHYYKLKHINRTLCVTLTYNCNTTSHITNKNVKMPSNETFMSCLICYPQLLFFNFCAKPGIKTWHAICISFKLISVSYTKIKERIISSTISEKFNFCWVFISCSWGMNDGLMRCKLFEVEHTKIRKRKIVVLMYKKMRHAGLMLILLYNQSVESVP